MAKKKTAVKKKQPAKRATSKKAVARKPAAKRTRVRKTASAGSTKRCACHKACKPEHCFWVNNGPVVNSKKNLKHALRTMSDQQYQYHTDRDGNDFARWVRDCLQDHKCAVKLENAKTRTGAVRALTATCCK